MSRRELLFTFDCGSFGFVELDCPGVPVGRLASLAPTPPLVVGAAPFESLLPAADAAPPVPVSFFFFCFSLVGVMARGVII